MDRTPLSLNPINYILPTVSLATLAADSGAIRWLNSTVEATKSLLPVVTAQTIGPAMTTLMSAVPAEWNGIRTAREDSIDVIEQSSACTLLGVFTTPTTLL